MAMHEKKQKGLVSEGCNGVELLMIDKDGPNNLAGAAGVDICNIDNHPYLENNPYRELANDDDEDNTAGDTDIEIVEAPAAIPKKIIDIDEEST